MGDKLAVNKAKAEVVMASAFCYEEMKTVRMCAEKPSPRGKEGTHKRSAVGGRGTRVKVG